LRQEAGNVSHLASFWAIKPWFHYPLMHSLLAYWRGLLLLHVRLIHGGGHSIRARLRKERGDSKRSLYAEQSRVRSGGSSGKWECCPKSIFWGVTSEWQSAPPATAPVTKTGHPLGEKVPKVGETFPSPGTLTHGSSRSHCVRRASTPLARAVPLRGGENLCPATLVSSIA
jgi:hypothetical protein